jgi:outer membrane protein OmpA-like peptidoglycan-associated protein
MRTNRGFGRAWVLAPSLACMLSVAAPADAADSEEAATQVSPFEIGIFGGLHFYEKDHGLSRQQGDNTGSSPDTGGAFGLRLGFNLNEWIGAEAEGLISPTRTRNDSTRDIILGYRAHIIATFIHSGYVRPFALFGYGALSAFPGTYSSEDGQWFPRSRDTDGFFHLGIGAKFPVTDDFGLRLDGRVMAPGAIAHDIVKVGSENGYGGPDWEVLLAAYLGMGAEKPSKAAPPAPPPARVVDQDPDKDGIVGAADKCPNQAEDKDGFQDEDGCPDPDNDKDGILDKDDKCPNEAEDKDGFEDDDGCPDPDNDKDGIPDEKDKCPDKPETVNNYQDEDGCPDEVPAAIQKFTGVIEGIRFKTGSAEITKDSHSVLDKAVQVLVDYPDVKLEVGGHTDNVGKAELNKELSQKRADAVKAYMVKKGIADDRLTAVGYGMDKPITSNKTAADKAKNRRTEFALQSGK